MTQASQQFVQNLLDDTDGGRHAPPGADGPAWKAIIADAAEQGMAPALYRWLRRTGILGSLPLDLSQRLTVGMARLAARNLLLARELVEILWAFESRAVACLPLRGLALAEQLYGDLAARPLGDLDLLVRHDDLARVRSILADLGFRAVDHRRGFAESFSYTLSFAKNRHGWVLVEPHWSIAYPPFVGRIDMAAVWGRCIRTDVVGVPTWRLAPEDLVLHLSLHLMHAGRAAPRLWYYELDRFIRTEQATLDWEQVVRRAADSGQLAICSEVFRRLTMMCDSPVPAGLVSATRRSQTRGPQSGRPSIRHHAVSLLAGESRLAGREEFAYVCTLDGLRPKLTYALSLVFPSPEFMRFRYGVHSRVVLGLAYLLRLGRLSWEGLQWAAALLMPRRRPVLP